jgi:hypothetical protein
MLYKTANLRNQLKNMGDEKIPPITITTFDDDKDNTTLTIDIFSL